MVTLGTAGLPQEGGWGCFPAIDGMCEVTKRKMNLLTLLNKPPLPSLGSVEEWCLFSQNI